MSLTQIDAGECTHILLKQHLIRTLIMSLHNVSVLKEPSSEYMIDTIQQQSQKNESSDTQFNSVSSVSCFNKVVF